MPHTRTLLAVLLILVTAARVHADPFVDAARSAAETAIRSARTPDALPGALSEIEAHARLAAAYAGPRQLEALAFTEGAARILEAARQARTALGPLADQPALCIELGLLLHEEDDAAAALALAKRISEERPKLAEQYPALAAAIAVVRDRPYTRQINENRVTAPEAMDVFDYFTANARRMRMDPASTPAPLLVHVVNVTESIDQLQWALARYGANPSPGDRFSEISYDTGHFTEGRPKKVTTAGNYRLESIKYHGGVCADQAYFAESVGKACGIPTVFVYAAGADVAHAWIGFLDDRRKAWNFDEGRYEAYENLRGNIRSPQTDKILSDAEVGLLAGLLTAQPAEIRTAMAAPLAAQRLARDDWKEPAAPSQSVARGTLRAPRTASIDDRLDLLKLAMTACASMPTGWQTVADFASEGQLEGKAMDEWTRAVDRMCGRGSPDFSFDFIKSLVSAVDKPADQHRLWEWAFTRYRARPDLASAVRFEQATLFAENDDPANAWAAYESIVKNFLNDGPMAVQALRAMTDMLAINKADRNAILPYLEDAARRVNMPEHMGDAFATQTNHYKIHTMLADRYTALGRHDDAQRIRERLLKRPVKITNIP